MPLDGHAFLLSQGWSGTGEGLRKGAISRPITAPQKKNLAGIGKDRADTFPFWDHVFTVAASAIQIECFSSDDDDDGPRPDAKETRSSTLELRQTSTGILSNRAPVVGTPVSSGATTPLNITPWPSAPRVSLLALAKRETARRSLYSRFFRGPILGPDDVQSEVVKTEPTATSQISFHHDDIKKRTKQQLKIDADTDDSLKEKCDRRERKREKRLRREAERATRKRKRQDAKNRAKDRKDEDTVSVDEVLSTSQEQGSGLLISTARGEVQREKKKRKRLKPAPVEDELDGETPVSTDKRILKGEDCSKSSRKRHRRD